MKHLLVSATLVLACLAVVPAPLTAQVDSGVIRLGAPPTAGEERFATEEVAIEAVRSMLESGKFGARSNITILT